jgi:hypothetical protein
MSPPLFGLPSGPPGGRTNSPSAPGGCPPNCPAPQIDAVDAALSAALIVTTLDEQKRHLKELSGLDQAARIEAALKILASEWVVAIPWAASAVQRDILIEHTKSELRNLMLQSVRASVAQITTDIRTLAPYYWNPLGSARRRELEQAERNVVETARSAEREISAQDTFREIRSGSNKSALQFKSGEALMQLRQIQSTGRWKNQ